MQLLSLLFADPTVGYVVVSVLGGLVGWWFRHQAGDPTPLPEEIVKLVKEALARKQAADAHAALVESLPHVKPPEPTGSVKPS